MLLNLVIKYFSFLSVHQSARWTGQRFRTFWWVFRSHRTFWWHFFEFYIWNFGVSKNWSTALFFDLARKVLIIFSRNDLQRFDVSWARSSCSFTNCQQYLTVMFLILKTANCKSYFITDTDLSMNILHAGNILPVQRGFFKNSASDLLPALRFLGRLHNFYSFVITFSLMQVTMICRRVTYFTDLGMINYQKTWSWNSNYTKTKNYARSYARYTKLKNHFLWFTLGPMTVKRISK